MSRDRLHLGLLRIVGVLTAPISMALTCRWRSPFLYVGNMTHSRLPTVCCFGKFAMRVFPRNKREIHWGSGLGHLRRFEPVLDDQRASGATGLCQARAIRPRLGDARLARRLHAAITLRSRRRVQPVGLSITDRS